jgi:hypothetical protein
MLTSSTAVKNQPEFDVTDPFDKLRLYGLLARRRVLEEFMTDQFALIEFFTKHLKTPKDVQKAIFFIHSLDMNESDCRYAINLVTAAVNIKIKAAKNVNGSSDE